MIFRRYEYGDESGIDSIESTLTSHPDYQDNWNRLVFPAWTWTGEANGRIAGVGGIIPYEGRAFAWMVLDKRADKRELVRALKMSIPLAQSFGFTLWTYVRDGFEAGHRFAKRFGLKKVELDKEKQCWLYEN